MKKLLNWLDNNILAIFSFFLLAFIPLYPKLPLFEAIPGYIVRVRLEDIIILTAFLIFVIQVIRKKATFKAIIFWPILIYIIIGGLSVFWSIFIARNIPFNTLHIGKMVLHYLRRIEYFSIFFIFYNAVKEIGDIKKFINWFLFIITALSIYGFGQKYLYWPVYSTMNREFSKGMRLYLTEHARVPSTFGGHYDLAAYLVIGLIIIISSFLLIKNKYLKLAFIFVYLLGYWLLILTASRTSYIAFLVSLTILSIFLGFKNGVFWAGKCWLGLMVFSLFIMLMFGDMSQRFAHFFNLKTIKEKLGIHQLLKPFKSPPVNSIALSDDLALVMDVTDERPTTKKPTGLPFDVYEDIPDLRLATQSATISAKTKEFMATMSGVMVPVGRTFSENAYKYGLSMAIRLDALWPWAWEGFKANPLLGSGYSTLNKSSLGSFTEAESTDNDYLRALGETGLLGFISFFAIIVIILKTALKTLRQKTNLYLYLFSISIIAYTIGLLVNALYIDVFEASKVALTYWALAGVYLAAVNLSPEKIASKKRKNKK